MVDRVQELASRLVALVGDDPARRDDLADVLADGALWLAPDGPSSSSAQEAWQAVLNALDELHGAGAYPLGRLPFVSDGLLDLLVRESHAQRPDPDERGRRGVGAAGRALANLAASPKLSAIVAAAVGGEVQPTYGAVYEYDSPGSHVGLHLDTRDFPLAFHLILEHEGGNRTSTLVVHQPGDPRPRRLRIRPGEGVVIRGRGTLHAWAPLGDDERRTLVAVGFRPR